MPGTAKRTVANPRATIRRSAGGGGGGAGIDPNKLTKELKRLTNSAKKMNDDLMEFNTPKKAWGAIKHGIIKPEQCVEVAFNLQMIPDQLSTTANQAMEMIKIAATSELGAFDVAPVRQTPVHQAPPVLVDDSVGARPLTRDERRHARSLNMEADEYLDYIRSNPGVVIPHNKPRSKVQLIPLKTGQGNDAFTGNGLKEPNQQGREESQQEEMRSLPRQEKYEHQNRASDVVQTDSDNEPVHDGHNAPSRHARESKADRVARLQRELAEAQRELRQTSQMEQIQKKLAMLNEGQLDEVSEVIDDLLYAEGTVDKVSVSQPVSRVAQGEIVSPDEIDDFLGNFDAETQDA